MDIIHELYLYRSNGILHKFLLCVLLYVLYLGNDVGQVYLHNEVDMFHLVFRKDLLFQLRYLTLRLLLPVQSDNRVRLPDSSYAMASRLQNLHLKYQLHCYSLLQCSLVNQSDSVEFSYDYGQVLPTHLIRLSRNSKEPCLQIVQDPLLLFSCFRLLHQFCDNHGILP